MSAESSKCWPAAELAYYWLKAVQLRSSIVVQVETQLARLVSLLDLKKATPKTPAPVQIEPTEPTNGEQQQLDAGHNQVPRSKDAQDTKVAGAPGRNKKAGKRKQTADDS